jgi:hypothetical protein
MYKYSDASTPQYNGKSMNATVIHAAKMTDQHVVTVAETSSNLLCVNAIDAERATRQDAFRCKKKNNSEKSYKREE